MHPVCLGVVNDNVIIATYFRVRYAVMQKCWKTAPEQRPSFTVLANILDSMLQQHRVSIRGGFRGGYSDIFRLVGEPPPTKPLVSLNATNAPGFRAYIKKHVSYLTLRK